VICKWKSLAEQIMRAGEKVRKFYEALLAAWGPQGWWPGETPLEVCVGAILTQNTAWRNVERAIANLKAAGVLEPRALWVLPEAELAELIRPAGYYHVKAGRLRNFLRLVVEEYDGSLERLFELPTERLRETVLGVRGIGRETADSMVLYAAGRPVFVVDAYTLRIAFRHGIVELDADYETLQEAFAGAIEKDVAAWQDYHALLVRAGKMHCKKQAPKCDGCPLKAFLEEGEPREPF
jgi:endonuclease-3 related protein